MDDLLAGQALQTRTILMFGEFTSALAQSVSQQLLLLASRSQADIKLVVNAQGGLVGDGEALFDVLRGIEPRVLVIGAGAVAGAPALAFVALPRAQRFCLPHARFSLGQRFGASLAPGADLLAAAQAVAAQRERITKIFAQQLGQPVETIAQEIERQDWLDAEEALAHGLVERIVTSANAL
jgi:ATP-dependent Clp protease protease subunit